MKMHLVMPMGGAGSRFKKNGYVIPKPLIKVNDKPLFYWATKSILKNNEIEDITFVVLKEHIDNYQIDISIKKYFKDANIVVLDHILDGAVLTALEGVKTINDDNPVIFNDCDHMFISAELSKYLKERKELEIDGALLTFKSNENKFSYILLNNENNVIKTKEKEVISDDAICGAYLFKNKECFINYTKKYLDNCDYNEFFMSGVYNEMIKDNKIIKNFNCDFHVSFGTPEEYEENKDSKYFIEVE